MGPKKKRWLHGVLENLVLVVIVIGILEGKDVRLQGTLRNVLLALESDVDVYCVASNQSSQQTSKGTKAT